MLARVAQSIHGWSLVCGTTMSTATPRIAAMASALSRLSSGRKYGVITPMLVHAQAIACRIANSTFSTSWSGPELITRAGAPSSCRLPGSQASPPRSSLVANAQSARKASVSCETIGPSIRKWMSCTGDFGPVAMTFSSPTFMPPVKPTEPSATRIFRCDRRLRNGMRQGSGECMKRAAATPFRRNLRYARDSSQPPPNPSISTRTATPRPCASASAAMKCPPQESSRKMYDDMPTLRVAAAIAASIAG